MKFKKITNKATKSLIVFIFTGLTFSLIGAQHVYKYLKHHPETAKPIRLTQTIIPYYISGKFTKDKLDADGKKMNIPGSPEDQVNAIRRGAKVWYDEGGSPVKFMYQGRTKNPIKKYQGPTDLTSRSGWLALDNVVFITKTTIADCLYEGTTLAATTINPFWGEKDKPPSPYEILHFDICFSDDIKDQETDPKTKKKYWKDLYWNHDITDDRSGRDRSDEIDIQAVATHEFGHGLGLDHTAEIKEIKAKTPDSAPCRTYSISQRPIMCPCNYNNRSLQEYDILALQNLYGRRPNLDDDNDGVYKDSDVDDDNNGLIEIHDLDMFDHIRNNLAGTAYNDGTGNNTTGAPTKATTNCKTDSNNDGKFLCGYELMRDLDFAGPGSYANGRVNRAWLPHGINHLQATNPGFVGPEGFSGIFDGNGYSISNLYSRERNNTIDWTTPFHDFHVGLFKSIKKGTVRNLGIINANVYGDYHPDIARNSSSVGTLAGLVLESEIIDSYAEGGSANGNARTNSIGGLVGTLYKSTIKGSYARDTQYAGMVLTTGSVV